MDYQETIDYLYAHLPMYSRIGAAAYKEDLHNTLALCDAIGNPQTKIKTIHIAGTNGKGSTSHMLAAILQKAGYKTGLHTSPHLKDFRERIRINGELVSKEFVVDFTERIRRLSESIEPSFFEVTVAMAFDYFASEGVDIAIIETGLGGRLDSTNVITPLLSIITNIGFDHMNILGNTLEQIATEKAGIIKPGIPIVIGEATPGTAAVFSHTAALVNAPIQYAASEFQVALMEQQSQGLFCTAIENNTGKTFNFQLDLTGLYQLQNLRTILCGTRLLRQQGFVISETAEQNALAQVKELTGLRGRWDVISEQPLVVLDVAHNADGIKAVLQQLNFISTQNENKPTLFHFVIGMVKDKDITTILQALPVTGRYYFTQAHIPRALEVAELQHIAAAYGLQGSAYENVNSAIEAAKKMASPADIILVCGSIFVIAEVGELQPEALNKEIALPELSSQATA